MLTAEKALIFRITHIDNVPWLLRNGVCCRSSRKQHKGFRRIGNEELIEKRNHWGVKVSPYGTLSDYVPFYFTPYSRMLLNIKTGWNGTPKVPMSDIAILRSSLHHIAALEIPFIYTNQHACSAGARYLSDLKDLDKIDWKILAARDFARDLNDMGKGIRYQAEALIYGDLPIEGLECIACHSATQKKRVEADVEEAGVPVTVLAKPSWYFS